ncbi:MAG: hypothetical protein JOY81_05240 [Alphaproteobacteria bacterium]|nr:hypothetical protein [Alphaproteobacteria bacterium]
MIRSLLFFALMLVAGFVATDLLSIALEDRAVAERPVDQGAVHDGAPTDTREM